MEQNFIGTTPIRGRKSGDEWSAWLGRAAAAAVRRFHLPPRIARWLPARRILEIAPGFGRWTQFLLRHGEELYGVDLNPRCIERCRQRFAAHDRAYFIQNDGVSLQVIDDGAIDFVFSFDSLVHVELDILAPYCQQIVRKLGPSGVAFLHHSNAANGIDANNPNAEGRAKSVSSQAVREVIEKAGGRVLMRRKKSIGAASRGPTASPPSARLPPTRTCRRCGWRTTTSCPR